MKTKDHYRKLGLVGLIPSAPENPNYEYLINNLPDGLSSEDIETFANTQYEVPITPVIGGGGVDLTIGGYRQNWGYSMADPLARGEKIIGYWDLVAWPSNLTKNQAIANIRIRIQRTCFMNGSFEPSCPHIEYMKCGDCIGVNSVDYYNQRTLGWTATLNVLINIFGTSNTTNDKLYAVRFLMAECKSFESNKLVGQRREGSDVALCDTLRYIRSATGCSKMIESYNNSLLKDSFGNIIPGPSGPGSNGGFLFSNLNNQADSVILFTTNNKEASGGYAN